MEISHFYISAGNVIKRSRILTLLLKHSFKKKKERFGSDIHGFPAKMHCIPRAGPVVFYVRVCSKAPLKIQWWGNGNKAFLQCFFLWNSKSFAVRNSTFSHCHPGSQGLKWLQYLNVDCHNLHYWYPGETSYLWLFPGTSAGLPPHRTIFIFFFFILSFLSQILIFILYCYCSTVCNSSCQIQSS